jgi:hypothetical protein
MKAKVKTSSASVSTSPKTARPSGFKLNSRVAYTLLSAAIIIAGTYVAIQFAKGRYRFTQQGVLQGTGLLSANSFPTGSQVMIDDRLVTATDDTIYLEPGTYQVKIIKDGYSPWEKTLTIEPELVTQTNAQLFPAAPSLVPVTFTGVSKVVPSPDGQKLLFHTASASSSLRNGLYVIDLNSNPLSMQRGPRQITDDSPELELDQTSFIWSPDSSQLLLVSDNRSLLLDTNQKSSLGSLPDVGFRRRQILAEWQEEMYLREREFLTVFPPEIIALATSSARNVYFSPDKKKLLYTASASAAIPENIVPPVPATNTQPESRQIEPGNIYVYDREEDKNFLIGIEKNPITNNDKRLLAIDLYNRQPLTLEASLSAFTTLQASTSAQTAQNFAVYHTPLRAGTLQWLADSRHLIYTANDTIRVIEYDSTNDTTLYAGPFLGNFIYPWPDGSQLLIQTSFSPNSPPNLYGIELRK